MSLKDQIRIRLNEKGLYDLSDEQKEKKVDDVLKDLSKITVDYPEAASEVLRGSWRVENEPNQS